MRLGLHRSIYPPAAVRAAAEAYGGLARIEVAEHDHEVVATFAEVDPEVEEVLLDAFANHALFEAARTRGAGRAGGVADG